MAGGNYAALAALFATHPEAVVLRRFKILALQNLLYLQAELAHLEQELQEIVDLQHEIPELAGLSKVDLHWKPPESDQNIHLYWEKYREKFLKIRETLSAYYTACSQYDIIRNIDYPSQGQLKDLRKWLQQLEYGSAFLAGSVEDVWNADNDVGIQDLVAFSKPGATVQGVARLVLQLRRRLTRQKSLTLNRVFSIDGTSEGMLSRGILTVLASLFPVLPIIILNFIEGLVLRLLTISIATGTLAAMLVFGLDLDSEKVLAVTTAFAAIQVVFVGGTSQKVD